MANDPMSLAELEVVREFKKLMTQTESGKNDSPFDDRVCTTHGGKPHAIDLNEMHDDVRTHIKSTISSVCKGQKSQVILLSGAAGSGKTHLLRTFETPESMTELGHVFVGGNNHWKIEDFQACLLNWTIEALTADESKNADEHLLLHRIRAIGYSAIELLLSSPATWKKYLAQPRGGWLGRIFSRRMRPSYEKIEQLTKARDPRVFGYLDFAAFSKFICDQFLANPKNLTHRYALRVLLIYLFPDKHETGIGTRERVLHWFRGEADNNYFMNRLGAKELPDKTYSQFDALKLLAHLFSPAVSSQLNTEAFPCKPRVLLLTFDQIEGRDELFEKETDWKDFFAYLSELYNTLPNVVVLFTMTLGLKDSLVGVMERQFRDRIRMDARFTLKMPTDDQYLTLYRSRIIHWLDAETSGVKAQYHSLENPFVPFEREKVVLIASNRAIRFALEELDKEFRTSIGGTPTGPRIDYLYDRNERKKDEEAQTENDYTSQTIQTLQVMYSQLGAILLRHFGLELSEMNQSSLGTIPLIRFKFVLPEQKKWIVIYVARVGRNYKAPLANLVEHCLYNRGRSQNFLYVVRPQIINVDWSEILDMRYHEQFDTNLCSVETESIFRSLMVIDNNRGKYPTTENQEALDQLILQEIQKTYFGEVLRMARLKLDALTVAEVDSSPEIAILE